MNQSSFTAMPGTPEYNNQLNSMPLLARPFLGNQSNTTPSNWGNFYKNAIASQNNAASLNPFGSGTNQPLFSPMTATNSGSVPNASFMPGEWDESASMPPPRPDVIESDPTSSTQGQQPQQIFQQMSQNLSALAGQQPQQTVAPQFQIDPNMVPIAPNVPIQRTSPLQALTQIYGGYQNSSPKVLGLLSKYGGGK